MKKPREFSDREFYERFVQPDREADACPCANCRADPLPQVTPADESFVEQAEPVVLPFERSDR